AVEIEKGVPEVRRAEMPRFRKERSGVRTIWPFLNSHRVLDCQCRFSLREVQPEQAAAEEIPNLMIGCRGHILNLRICIEPKSKTPVTVNLNAHAVLCGKAARRHDPDLDPVSQNL